jgi:hypothetical protein
VRPVERNCNWLLNQCEMCGRVVWAAMSLNASSITKLQTKKPGQEQGVHFAKLRWRFAANLSGTCNVGFVVYKEPLGQVFSEYFGFPCYSFHWLLHTHHHHHHHLSSGAGTLGQTVTDVPSGLSLTPPEKLKKVKNKLGFANCFMLVSCLGYAYRWGEVKCSFEKYADWLHGVICRKIGLLRTCYACICYFTFITWIFTMRIQSATCQEG